MAEYENKPEVVSQKSTVLLRQHPAPVWHPKWSEGMPSPSPRSLHRFLLFFFFLRVDRGRARLRGVHGLRDRHELLQPLLLERCQRGSVDQGHELIPDALAAHLPRLEGLLRLLLSSSEPRAPSPPATERGGRRGLQRPRPRLPHPPETARRAAASRPLRSAAGCGHFSAARAPAGCLAAPLVEESSVPVGRRAKLAPPPPWLWRRSSVPVGRHSAARCGASQLPEPCGRSAVRVATTNAAAAPVGASRLLLRRVARWTQPSFRNYA